MKYAKTYPLIPISSGKGLGQLTYEVPESLRGDLKPGQLVEVKVRGKTRKAIITELTDEKPDFDTKPIEKILVEKPLVDKENINLAQEIADHYLTSMGSALRLFIPPVRQFKFKKSYTLTEEPDEKVHKKQREIIDYLKENEVLKENELEKKDLSPHSLSTLVDKGLVEEHAEIHYRQPTIKNVKDKERPTLTDAQTQALKNIKESDKPNLLFGVPGSGKTEIYLRLAEEKLKNDEGSIILVPEIALTPQTVNRFVSRLGKENIAVLHSQMKGSVRFDQWMQLLNGEKKIVIGPRSALFAPVQNLGLVVIDEEHDQSYKQESSPRYNAKWVAEKMSEIQNVNLVLGSATPSIESYHKAQNEDWNLASLPDHIFQDSDDQIVKVVDMQKEVQKGNKGNFSELLMLGIEQALKNDEQALLFLNRRGTKSVARCEDCGETVDCPNCEIPLVYHRDQKSDTHKLKCHHCGFERDAVISCPECGSPRVKYYGTGTEEIATTLRREFPDAEVFRFDRDTIKTHEDHVRAYQKIRDHEVDLIVGTQMIAKGWDIPDLTLVGLIIADIGFNFPDFHTYERMFSLITQVIGRSGRREVPGKVVIQTYNPENDVLNFAINKDYESFYEKEMESRKEFGWPPAVQVVRLLKRGESADALAKETEKTADKLLKELGGKGVEINHGPCFFSKIRGKYRYQIVLRGENVNQKLNPEWVEGWTIDVDPMSML